MKRAITLFAIVATASLSFVFAKTNDLESKIAAFMGSSVGDDCNINPASSLESKWLKYRFIDKKGKFISKASYEKAHQFSDDLAAVRVNGRWGYINRSGEEVIKPQYLKVEDFHNGLAIVKRNGLYAGYINKQGEYIIPPTLTQANNFRENGTAIIRCGKQFGMIDRSGKVLLPSIYERLGEFSEERATIEFNERYGLIDALGKIIVEPKYDALGQCSEGMIAFREKDVWGYLNRKGDVALPARFKQADKFIDGVAAVQQSDGSCTLITEDGTIVFTFPKKGKRGIATVPKMDLRSERQRFPDGLIPMMGKDGWGYASTDTGEFVIEPRFKSAEYFKNGIAIVGILKFYDDDDQSEDETEDEKD